MTDIVERLRELYVSDGTNYVQLEMEVAATLVNEVLKERLHEAAYTIERLRAQLAEARLNWKLCEDQLLALRAQLAEARLILIGVCGNPSRALWVNSHARAFLAKHKEQA